MKKAIVLVLLLLFAAGMAYGQDKVYRDNNLGLVFLFSGLSNSLLVNYNGGFGAKLNMGVFAIRPVVIFAMGGSKDPELKSNPPWISDENSMSLFGFGGSFLFNLKTTGRIIPYVGAGAIVEFGSTKNIAGHATADAADEFTTSQFGFAGHALIGFEFFIVKNVSFSGEYRLGYGTSTVTDKSEWADPTWDDTEVESSMWGMGVISSTVLILTVYMM